MWALKKNYHLLALPALGILFLDQITKWAVVGHLRLHETVPVIAGVFNLVHVRNRGMAFGMLNSLQGNLGFYLLTAASMSAIILLLYWFIRLKEGGTWITLGLSFIVGGAFGNLLDRLTYGEVIDFFDFYVGSYHWPAFNVADSAITVGTFLIALSLFHKRPNT